MQRIYLTIASDEWTALVRAAGRNCRDPKQEARYLLRRALMGEQPPDPPPAPAAPMTSGAAVSQTTGAALVTI